MMLTLTLAAGLLAAPEPRAEPPKGRVVEIYGYTEQPKQAGPGKGEGWTIEVRGYTYHPEDVPQLLLKGWTIEVGGHTYHLKQPERRKEFIIEFQWEPQREPVEGQYRPVEAQYLNDLSAFFEPWKVQVDPVEAFYIDDLHACVKQLKKR